METITLQQISLHLKKTKDGRPYLLATQVLPGGKEKKGCWFPEDWKAICQAMDGSEDRTAIHIRARRRVQVNKGPLTIYIATQTLDEDGKVVRWFYIVLEKEDWSKLMELRYVIDDMLAERPAARSTPRKAECVDERLEKKRLKLDIPPQPCLTQYKWKFGWRNGAYNEGDEWFFLEADCREDAPKDVGEYNIITRQIPRPSPHQMAEWVYRYLLRRELKLYMLNNCEGCVVDRPSQIDHMERGCMSEWHDGLDMLDRVVDTVTPQRVAFKCQMVWELLDGSRDTGAPDLSTLSLDNLYVPVEYLRIFDKPGRRRTY